MSQIVPINILIIQCKEIEAQRVGSVRERTQHINGFGARCPASVCSVCFDLDLQRLHVCLTYEVEFEGEKTEFKTELIYCKRTTYDEAPAAETSRDAT